MFLDYLFIPNNENNYLLSSLSSLISNDKSRNIENLFVYPDILEDTKKNIQQIIIIKKLKKSKFINEILITICNELNSSCNPISIINYIIQISSYVPQKNKDLINESINELPYTLIDPKKYKLCKIISSTKQFSKLHDDRTYKNLLNTLDLTDQKCELMMILDIILVKYYFKLSNSSICFMVMKNILGYYYALQLQKQHKLFPVAVQSQLNDYSNYKGITNDDYIKYRMEEKFTLVIPDTLYFKSSEGNIAGCAETCVYNYINILLYDGTKIVISRFPERLHGSKLYLFYKKYFSDTLNQNKSIYDDSIFNEFVSIISHIKGIKYLSLSGNDIELSPTSKNFYQLILILFNINELSTIQHIVDDNVDNVDNEEDDNDDNEDKENEIIIITKILCKEFTKKYKILKFNSYDGYQNLIFDNLSLSFSDNHCSSIKRKQYGFQLYYNCDENENGCYGYNGETINTNNIFNKYYIINVINLLMTSDDNKICLNTNVLLTQKITIPILKETITLFYMYLNNEQFSQQYYRLNEELSISIIDIDKNIELFKVLKLKKYNSLLYYKYKTLSLDKFLIYIEKNIDLFNIVEWYYYYSLSNKFHYILDLKQLLKDNNIIMPDNLFDVDFLMYYIHLIKNKLTMNDSRIYIDYSLIGKTAYLFTFIYSETIKNKKSSMFDLAKLLLKFLFNYELTHELYTTCNGDLTKIPSTIGQDIVNYDKNLHTTRFYDDVGMIINNKLVYSSITIYHNYIKSKIW